MVIESEKRNSHLQKNHIDLQLKFQNYKQCIDTSSASNAIFEINKLRKQLQGKDDTIRNLETQINITRMLNVGSTKGSCDQQAFETDRIQLKDTITSLRIQLDGLKVEHLSALTAGKFQAEAQVTGKTSSGPSTSEKPKVLASGIYNLGFSGLQLDPHKTTSENARRADHNRKLNVVDHNQFVIRSLKSVNTKTPQAKHSVNHTKKVWKATRNHNVNTTKTAWRPTGKVVGSVKPQWKPTGRHFALYDNCPLTRIMEPIVEPLELTPSVSSSSKVTMISRFTDCKLSDRKAGSKGISGQLGRNVADSIAERLKRPTAYKFRQIAVSLLSRNL
ncbi:hypothetical protein Tco_0117818 [Tanacetum coccineum]